MFNNLNEALNWLYEQKKLKKREDLSRIDHLIKKLNIDFDPKVEEESQEEESKETESSEETQEQVNEVQEEIVVNQESEAQQESEVQQENSELANTLLARAAELSKQNKEEDSKTIKSDSSQIQERKQLEDEKVASVQSIEDSNEIKDTQPKYESLAEVFTQLKSFHDKEQEKAFESKENNNPHLDKLEKIEVHENKQPFDTSEKTPKQTEKVTGLDMFR